VWAAVIAALLVTPAGHARADDFAEDDFGEIEIAAPRSEASPEPQRVDRVLVVVGNILITESDLRLEEALRERAPSLVPPLQALRDDALDALVDRAILRTQAGQASVYQPVERELQLRIRALERTFDSPAEWQSFRRIHGLDEDRLTASFRTLAVAEQVVQRNVGLALPDGADDDTYLAAYEAWMAVRRPRTPIRHIRAIDAQ